MKIYNEVTTIFNDDTGKWETISEDSYEHGGDVSLLREANTAQVIPDDYVPVDPNDWSWWEDFFKTGEDSFELVESEMHKWTEKYGDGDPPTARDLLDG